MKREIDVDIYNDGVFNYIEISRNSYQFDLSTPCIPADPSYGSKLVTPNEIINPNKHVMFLCGLKYCKIEGRPQEVDASRLYITVSKNGMINAIYTVGWVSFDENGIMTGKNF